MVESQVSLESWEGIVSNYLKADVLEEKEGSFIVQDVKLVEHLGNDGVKRQRIELSIEIDNETYVFPLNWTNTKKVKSIVGKPRDLLNKSISYQKIRVTNPSTKEIVDSISIVDIK